MLSASDIAREFVARQLGAADAAFLDAFRDGFEEAMDELFADIEEDERPDFDWQLLLAQAAQERRQILAFYLPALPKMASELTTLFGLREGQILSAMSAGLTREEALETATVRAYTEQIEKTLVSINTRIAQLFAGLTWAASELARGMLAGVMGRRLYWILDPRAEHCPTCPELAANGPYASIAEIGTVPGAEGTDCKSRCRCHLEYE